MGLTQSMEVQTPNEFNQVNVNGLIKTIQDLPILERLGLTSQIKVNLPGFLAANFNLTPQWRTIIGNMPATDSAEIGIIAAFALDNDLGLFVEIPDETPVAAASCKVTDARPTRFRDPFSGQYIYGF